MLQQEHRNIVAFVDFVLGQEMKSKALTAWAREARFLQSVHVPCVLGDSVAFYCSPFVPKTTPAGRRPGDCPFPGGMRRWAPITGHIEHIMANTSARQLHCSAGKCVQLTLNRTADRWKDGRLMEIIANAPK